MTLPDPDELRREGVPEPLVDYVEWADRRLRLLARALVILMVASLCGILIAGATGGLAMVNAVHVENLEQADTQLGREAAARQCVRGNITRAELHAAYRPRPKAPTSPLSPLVADQPVLRALLTAADLNRVEGLDRVQTSQPILDCVPNLVGKEAVPYSRPVQARFVTLYLAKKLDPTPEADDVLKGFDTEIEPQSDLPGG
jgi:hypothetical protein